MERLEEFWFNHRNKIIAILIVIMLLTICGRGLLHQKPKETSPLMEMASSTSNSVSQESQSKIVKEICVDVKGAVAKPGVYHLKNGSRVTEALKAAGHETADADMTQVNLAKQLVDAQVIYVPKKGEKIPTSFDTTQSSVGETGTADNHEITNLNTATKEQLCKITGIGDKKADLILQYRQEHGNFKSVDDLKNINGFGEKTVAKLKPMLAV